LKDFSLLAYAKTIAEAAKTEEAKVVLFGTNPEGKALAPAVTVNLDASVAAEVVALPTSYEPFTISKKAYTAKAFAETVLSGDVKVLTLTQNSFKLKENKKDLNIEEFGSEIPENAYDVQPTEVLKTKGKLSVTDAEIVVSGGRGLKGPENWGMIEEMADILGAANSCSRPVSDLEWRSHDEHVGQTGKIIAPNLYFAIAISGAVQHIAGVNGSKVIVGVNIDEEAPIFEAADYGIVGDAFKVIPKLNESLKKFMDEK
ncbi:MAG: electron transfer flavoprotein subunit alpha/FixB family protein, partial [Bacteroidota bacterium]|nr:electron transfer flavoprotein subunit alpha/FixB family protein [Bacteroidota bacterium]